MQLILHFYFYIFNFDIMPNPKIFGRFSENLKKALKTAEDTAQKDSFEHIENIHLLYGLVSQKGSIAEGILKKFKVTKQAIEKEITASKAEQKHYRMSKNKIKPKISPGLKKTLMTAIKTARNFSHLYISTEHILYALINLVTTDKRIQTVFQKANVSIPLISEQTLSILKSTSKFPEIINPFQNKPKKKTPPRPSIIPPELSMQSEFNQPGIPMMEPHQPEQKMLDLFSINLVQQAKKGLIDEIVGRDKEIARLINILSRRQKNNGILIGEAGVGKTAIAEGLALKIHRNQVPEILENKKIHSLDLTSLISGAMFRGEFESRIKQLLHEVKQDPDIILFIDEIHNMVGAGSASGSMDTANILKPYLARGEIRCIGATTLDEYKKYIERDSALERRFQTIFVDELKADTAIKVLQAIKRAYELYHTVKISDSAIKASVTLSEKYIPNSYLPDKAIDLLDEASAKVKVLRKPLPINKQVNKLKDKLKQVQEEKIVLITEERFSEALEMKKYEEGLFAELNKLEEKRQKQIQKDITTITHEHIADVISEKFNIPKDEVSISPKKDLVELDKILKKSVIGQDEAISEVAKFIRKSKAGLKDHKKPIGSFIFLGPTGVGKTYLAKEIARIIFKDENALLRLDMSEFGKAFNASKLLGAPAGYVGYRDRNKFDILKQKPYQVVLFDEIEKAHPDIFNILLQILDEGRVTDASGKEINFRNTIIIMTSNIGLANMQKQKIGFEEDAKEQKKVFEEIKIEIEQDLKHEFKPEFLNRIDKIIVFKPLNITDIKTIAKLFIAETNARLADQKLSIKVPPTVLTWLAVNGYNESEGARSLKRFIEQYLEDPLAIDILEEKFKEGDKIEAKVVKDKVVFG